MWFGLAIVEEDPSSKVHRYPASALVVVLANETELPWQLSEAEKFTIGPSETTGIVFIFSFSQPGISAFSLMS